MKVWENNIQCKKCGVIVDRANLGERNGTIIRYFKFFEYYKWEEGICDGCIKSKSRKMKTKIKDKIIARQCLKFKGYSCDNSDCKNIECPLYKDILEGLNCEEKVKMEKEFNLIEKIDELIPYYTIDQKEFEAGDNMREDIKKIIKEFIKRFDEIIGHIHNEVDKQYLRKFLHKLVEDKLS